jgi:hypothetical protein
MPPLNAPHRNSKNELLSGIGKQNGAIQGVIILSVVAP